ncbi:hypothetical protein KIN20_014044 [Parelaphostrongylus tenuis]|uniref:Uncharacterized protein n=1 Tax=Parelaphostrongylus tenuis TaxID=148309 RepID=A0AAD5MYY3_PARTN|nr:hypothetical protein KIN20_014044 [Parelaphostrongylus tenuis]
MYPGHCRWRTPVDDMVAQRQGRWRCRSNQDKPKSSTLSQSVQDDSTTTELK